MFLISAAFALLAVSGASYQQQIPHILITTNPRNQHTINKICRIARQNQYRGIIPAEFGPTPFHQASETSKIIIRVNDCCDRTSISGRKECLQIVRNDMMDSMCHQSPSGLCCGCEGLQKRMCIAQNPIYSPYMQASAFSYIDSQQQQDIYIDDEAEDEQDIMIMNANQCYHHSPIEECMDCNKFRQQIQRATQAAANQICIQRMIQGSQNAYSSCCQAGTSVGASAGQSHTNVCMPAARIFQRQILACGTSQNPSCAHAFAQCCRAANAAGQNQRDQFEQQIPEIYDDTIEQGFSYASHF